MNIALPVLLLVFGGLTFWVLTESKLKWYFKTACISAFCIFTIIFWSSIGSFLGWPASEKDLPEKILIHWVIIEEPNKFIKFDGAIYILLESAEEDDRHAVLKFFGYKRNKIEPRLYGLSYDRGLHEKLEREIIPSLRKGYPVVGKLSKQKSGMGKNKGESEGKGDGSESQEQEWHFHKLLPSEMQGKPER